MFSKIMDIVLATRNKKKVEEIKRILTGIDINFLAIDNFQGCPEVKEDGNTFYENAIKKAKDITYFTQKISLAEDSGLEVEALNKDPGVFSARYAGDIATDEENIRKLLDKMRNIPDDKRQARFVSVIALAYPNERIVTFEGFVSGFIGREIAGRNGFGYDPVFYPLGYKMTFAEMEPEQKDFISHRKKALEQLRKYLLKVN